MDMSKFPKDPFAPGQENFLITKALYDELVESGFTEDQALRFLAYMFAQIAVHTMQGSGNA